MALRALGIFRLAESLGSVVAHPAVLGLAVHLFRHEIFLLLHRENLGVAVGAFCLVGGHMGFVAERDRVRPLRGEFDIPSARFFLLGVSHAERNEADESKNDNEARPNFSFQLFTSFFRIGQADSDLRSVYPQEENSVKGKIPERLQDKFLSN
jgi:hypothetical protein